MIETLVASTVALITPYLGKAGEEAAKAVGKGGAEAGLTLLGWLRNKATGRTKEALADAEAKPTEDNKADLRKQLAKLLDANPALLSELQAQLPALPDEAVGQSMTLGENGRAVQNTGDSNNISIRG